MPRDSDSLDADLQIAILRFWAEGISITQRFSSAQIKSVPGLLAAITAIEALPRAIGWDDEEPPESKNMRAPRRSA